MVDAHLAGVLAAAVAGGIWGRRARTLARTYRRPDDRPPRRLRWAVPAGALAGAWCVHVTSGWPGPVRVVALAAAAVLLLLALVDADVHRLPDALTRPLAVGLLAADAAAAVLTRDVGPLLHGVTGGAVLFGAFFALAMVGSGIGYGDVKLAGAVGVGLGALGVAPCVTMPVAGVVLGGLGALGLLATGRAGRHTHIALGPALVAGTLLALAAA